MSCSLTAKSRIPSHLPVGKLSKRLVPLQHLLSFGYHLVFNVHEMIDKKAEIPRFLFFLKLEGPEELLK